MYRYCNRICLSKGDYSLLIKRDLSKLITNPVRLKRIINTKSGIFQNNHKLPITSFKWRDAVSLKLYSSSSHTTQKVVVTIQETDICQNPDNITNDKTVGKNEVKKVDRITKYKRIIGASPTISNVRGKLNEIALRADPYIKIMRIDKPIGTWLLFWPCGWSIMLAVDPSITTAGAAIQNLSLFLTGAFIMRGAGCTINDMWDKDIDGKVERTRSRPLVSGQMSMKTATIFLAAQLSVGLGILLQLNWYSIFLGASSMGLVVLYPLAKRVTDYPQLILGLAFNWGALLGWSAMRGSVDPAVCLPLYGAGICWTLLYDTIYAHQDKKDDALIGIKSTALKFNKNTKPWLWANGVGFLTGLSTVGYVSDLQWPYFAVMSVVGAHVARQIWTLNPDNPQDCSSKFVSNSRVGFLIFVGIILGKWNSIAEYFKDNAKPIGRVMADDNVQLDSK